MQKQWLRTIYIVMKHLGWTWEEMRRLPLSTLGELQELMDWERRETERQQRANQRRK